MDEIYNKIESIAAKSNGFVRTSQIETAGIGRGVIKKYVESGLLERVRKGIFVPLNADIDEFALLQRRCFFIWYSSLCLGIDRHYPAYIRYLSSTGRKYFKITSR